MPFYENYLKRELLNLMGLEMHVMCYELVGWFFKKQEIVGFFFISFKNKRVIYLMDLLFLEFFNNFIFHKRFL